MSCGQGLDLQSTAVCCMVPYTTAACMVRPSARAVAACTAQSCLATNSWPAAIYSAIISMPLCRVEFMVTSSCDLLSCTLAWDSRSGPGIGDAGQTQGSTSLAEAAEAALDALAQLRPPAAFSAPALQVCLMMGGCAELP